MNRYVVMPDMPMGLAIDASVHPHQEHLVRCNMQECLERGGHQVPGSELPSIDDIPCAEPRGGKVGDGGGNLMDASDLSIPRPDYFV